jgi:hypothetical protein
VLAWSKEHFEEHFEEHLNEGSGLEQPTRPVDLRDDRVNVDLPSREEIEGTLKYLKNNKAAGADSIVGELLKNGEPNLLDAYMKWSSRPELDTTEKLDRIGINEAINSIVKTVKGFASWTWHTKSSPKFYATTFYPTLMRPFSITWLGFNQVNQQETNSLALRQILEKCNEFIDYKATYDTIIRNEVYVGMSESELNFPTKLIRLTKATLTIVTCCVKIQNDCSESFETRQGLRQGDVFSTLFFNVVLEVIVRRANLQTTGIIYNKETQLLAYTNDIEIVGRSQSAVRNTYLAFGRRSSQSRVKNNWTKDKMRPGMISRFVMWGKA